ncbi:MAG: rRNA maturation RNase YbeY [Chloroflexia bacterium]|nr:rRNA maturation RNase YbeY [Chloroflexia bacterium]
MRSRGDGIPRAGGDGAFSVEVALVVTNLSAPSIDPGEITRLVGETLGAEHSTGAWEVTVAIVPDDHLAALHAQFLGDPAPTDIMTFPREELDTAGDGSVQGGDLVISWDRAAEQAVEHGLTTEREVAFLIVHGLLHLCGWRDDTDAMREAMLARGSAILRSLETA